MTVCCIEIPDRVGNDVCCYEIPDRVGNDVCFVIAGSDRQSVRDDGSEDQHLVVSEMIISRGYHFFTACQSLQHLIKLRVLPSYTDLASYSLAPFRNYYIYPFSSCFLIKRASWNQQGLFRLAELQVQIVCLSGPYIMRLLSAELKIRLELAVAHLRIHLSYDSVIGLVLSLKR